MYDYDGNIIFKNNYPNVIVFTHNDMDGIFSAMIIKDIYDNNLKNPAFQAIEKGS